MEEIDKENFYAEQMDSFKSTIKCHIDGVLDSIVSDRLPYLESDRDYNVEFRANDVVSKLLSGQFLVSEDGYLKVDQDGFRISIEVSSSEWDGFRKSLVKIMPQCPKDKEIESLKEQLKDAYRRSY